MTDALHSIRFPGESTEYRSKRNTLLEAEIALRKQIESVAALRRGLPLGGRLKEDYVFEEANVSLDVDASGKNVRLSELFDDGKDSLVVYSFMYGPAMEHACPACTSIWTG